MPFASVSQVLGPSQDTGTGTIYDRDEKSEREPLASGTEGALDRAKQFFCKG